MNPLFPVVVLAMVQGLTEFLPISSSAHLILIPYLTGWPEQSLAFDVAVHFGSLLAIIHYFRRELVRLFLGFLRLLRGKPSFYYSRLVWQLLLASIPTLIVGGLCHNAVATYLRSPLIIALSTLFFGCLLGFCDRFATKQRSLPHMRWQDSLFIGFAQALALIPGTSRSGITITAALGRGFNRVSSAQFSFLLSLPVTGAATVYETYHLATRPVTFDWGILSLSVFIAASSAYFCIRLFLTFLPKISFLPFVVYRLLLGVFLLWLLA